MTNRSFKDKESDIKALALLIKEAGVQAKSLKNEAMLAHRQKLKEIVRNSTRLAP